MIIAYYKMIGSKNAPKSRRARANFHSAREAYRKEMSRINKERLSTEEGMRRQKEFLYNDKVIERMRATLTGRKLSESHKAAIKAALRAPNAKKAQSERSKEFFNRPGVREIYSDRAKLQAQARARTAKGRFS